MPLTSYAASGVSEKEQIYPLNLPSVHVTLTKNSKGYSWEISVRRTDSDVWAAVQDVEKANAYMKGTYGDATE